MNLLAVIVVSLLSSAGQLCQKQAAHCSLHRTYGSVFFWLSISMIFLGIAMLIWLFVLQRIPVSVAYPMLSLNFIFVSLAAHGIWKEPLRARQIVGTFIIIMGVAIMGIFA